jgi:hypothetical protein
MKAFLNQFILLVLFSVNFFLKKSIKIFIELLALLAFNFTILKVLILSLIRRDFI